MNPSWDWTSYHSYNKTDSFTLELFNMSSAHPDICKVFSIGKTWQGRDIWCVKISDNVNTEEDEPGIVYDGAHHAREWLTVEMCLFIAHKLVEEYGTNTTVTDLVNSRQFFIIPLLNVDGRVYDAKDDGNDPTDHNRASGWGWRKNCRDNNGNGVFDPDYDGVDLNRNYGYKWCNGGSDDWPGSDGYMGTDPFSEPETRAVRDLCLSHRIDAYLTYHSYSQVYIYPWAWSPKPCKDYTVYKTVAQQMVAMTTNKAGSHYPYEEGQINSPVMYVASGNTCDWTYGERGAFSYCEELYPNWNDADKDHEAAVSNPYDVFHPRQDKIKPACEDSLPAALYLAEIADNPYKVMQRHASLKTDSTSLLAIPGQTKNVTVELSNNGQTDDSYIISVASQTGWGTTVPGKLSLMSGQVQPFTLAVTPPSGALGKYAVIINATSENDTMVTDSLALSITVPSGNDAGVLSIASPVFGETLPLGVHDINTTIGNIGYNEQSNLTVKFEVRKLSSSTYTSTIFEDNFDGMDKGWTVEYSNSIDWEKGKPSGGGMNAHSFPNCFATNLSGNYPNDANDWLVSPEIRLPSNATTVTLSFWHWFKFHFYNQKYDYYDDFAYLKLYENGIWHLLKYYQNSSGGVWVNENIDIKQYCGKVVKIGFQVLSESALNELGWYVDDFKISAELKLETVVFTEPVTYKGTMGMGESARFIWRYLFAEEGDYRVVAYTILPGDSDPSNNMSDVVVTIQGGSTNRTWAQSLAAGWRFISVPLNSTETGINFLLSSIIGNVETIEYYNSSDTVDHWKSYCPGKPSYLTDLSSIDNSMAFWVKLSGASEIYLNATMPWHTTIKLKTGWNMMGYPSLSPMKVKYSFLAGIYIHIQCYDGSSKYSLKDLGPDDYLMPGEGYWVETVQDYTLVFP